MPAHWLVLISAQLPFKDLEARQPKRKGSEIPITVLGNAAANPEGLGGVLYRWKQLPRRTAGHAEGAQCDFYDCGPWLSQQHIDMHGAFHQIVGTPGTQLRSFNNQLRMKRPFSIFDVVLWAHAERAKGFRKQAFFLHLFQRGGRAAAHCRA